MICCPDNAVTTTTTTTTPGPPIAIKPARAGIAVNLPTLTDLNALQSNPNLNLVNDKKCGTSSVNRIVNGIVAKPGELPWM